MLRILTFAFFIATLGMAGVLYKIKYDSRSLQLEMVRLRQQIGVERQQVAVLKAEWSILTTPKRIDKFAKQLGLIPLSPEQIISFRDLEALPIDKSRPFASLSPLGEPDGSVLDELDVAEDKDDGLQALEDLGIGPADRAGGQKSGLQHNKLQNTAFQKGAFVEGGLAAFEHSVRSGKQDRLPNQRQVVTDFIEQASFEDGKLNQTGISKNSGEVKNAN